MCFPFLGQKGDSCLVCDTAGLRGPPGPQGPPGETGKTLTVKGTMSKFASIGLNLHSESILLCERPNFLYSKLKHKNENVMPYFQDLSTWFEIIKMAYKFSVIKTS